MQVSFRRRQDGDFAEQNLETLKHCGLPEFHGIIKKMIHGDLSEERSFMHIFQKIIKSCRQLCAEIKNKPLLLRIISLFAVTAVFVFGIKACIEVGALIENSGSESKSGAYDVNLLYYNALSLKQKNLYAAIADAAAVCAEYSDSLPYSYDSSDIELVNRYLKSENPDLFYVDFDSIELKVSSHRSMVKMAYFAAPNIIDAMKTELDERAKEITDGMKTGGQFSDDIKDDIEKELYLHDALVGVCGIKQDTSEKAGLFGTAYGALVLGEAYSDGYAQAFQLLLSKVGIYSTLVSGRTVPTSTEEEPWLIFWNLVHADGSYYYTNVFRDDPDIQDDPSFAFHTYFNLSYEEIFASHIPRDDAVIPHSDNEFNYYETAGLTADSEEELTALLVRQIENAVSNETRYGELYTEFSPQSDTVYNSMLSAIRTVNGKIAEYGDEGGKKIIEVADVTKISAFSDAVLFKLYFTEN